MEFAAQKYTSGRPNDDRSPNLMAQKMTNVGLEQNTIVYQTTDLTAEGGKYQALTDGTCITTTRWAGGNNINDDDYQTLLDAPKRLQSSQYETIHVTSYGVLSLSIFLLL